MISSNGCAPFRPHQGGPAQPWLKCCAWSVWRTRPRFGSDGYDTIIDEEGNNVSAGEKQLITIARAFLSEPELLILDEPTAGLDPASRARVHDLILERVDDAATVLMTSHDLAEVERLASRVVIMGRGRVFADGTVTELREQFSGTAQVTWHEAGERHVHATSSPEGFVKTLDLDAISGLTIPRPNLEDAYLALTKEERK